MRKLISLGLMALMFSLFSVNAFADVDDCEQVKGEKKGLYGLCIAYWNTTNAKAQEQILANYRKHAGEDGPDMPGLEEFTPCTCWTSDHVLEAMDESELAAYSCGGVVETVNVFTDNTFTFLAGSTVCFFVHPEDGVPPTAYSSIEAEMTCRAQIQEIIFEVTGDDCQ